ncbi:MAG: hypothetical protein LOD92_08445, partial [Bacillales bacterium]
GPSVRPFTYTNIEEPTQRYGKMNADKTGGIQPPNPETGMREQTATAEPAIASPTENRAIRRRSIPNTGVPALWTVNNFE